MGTVVFPECRCLSAPRVRYLLTGQLVIAMCKKERDWGKPKKGLCALGEVGVNVLYKAMNL